MNKRTGREGVTHLDQTNAAGRAPRASTDMRIGWTHVETAAVDVSDASCSFSFTPLLRGGRSPSASQPVSAAAVTARRAGRSSSAHSAASTF